MTLVRSLRPALLTLLALAPACFAQNPAPPIAPGPFQADPATFDQYRYPDWFRDAKLGIWAHWGPQSVPMFGDWYARQMYQQGHPQYEDHLKRYGHPSEHGYKEIIPQWKAEKWDPAALMALYKKAGAKYFVSMGVHHDNFDLWNSTYHKWNAVKMGPMRDVVGDWQKAARAEGLRFGVSEHLGASFTWWQDSHKADKTGPKAGVPYDGADPKYEDLYHPAALPGDNGWYSNDPRWHAEWFARIKDLVDHYQPDLLYSDGPLPFQNATGAALVAHYYNSSAALHNGVPDVAYTCKQKSNGRWVEDLERGVMPGINPQPWQTDTSIGDWFYNRNWKYRGADWVIQMLVDIVSKNGNLLINVVQRPDGSLDPEPRQVLADMADWIAINGEAIYGTRPWLVYGEGPIRARGGNFKEDFAFTAQDIRFTTKGDHTLYVFTLGWPAGGKLNVKSLARFPGVTGQIKKVELLGHDGPITFQHGDAGLDITLPPSAPAKYAVAFKLEVDDLKAFKPELAIPASPAVEASADGRATLPADAAVLQGNLKVEDHGGQPNIGYWDGSNDTASWNVKGLKPGKYELTIDYASVAPADLAIKSGDKHLEASLPATGGFDKFESRSLGTLEVPAATGPTPIEALPGKSWKPINLRSLKLAPAPN